MAKLRFWCRVIALVGIFCLTAMLAIQRVDPSRFDLSKTQEVFFAVLLGFFAVVTPSFDLWAEAHQPISPRGKEAGRVQLSAVLERALTVTGGDWRDYGTSLFVVHGSLWWKRQILVERVRLSVLPAPPTTRWKKGVGVIGECWQGGGEELFFDTEEEFGPHRNASKAEWEALSTEKRRGLSFKDFQQVKDLGFILVVPIMRGSAYLGCVTIDGPTASRPSILGPDIRAALAAASDTIAPLLNS